MKNSFQSTIPRGGGYVGVILILYFFIVLRDAWVGDDAYITMRTVHQLFEGNGLVWNFNERVQAYTHPLWMFLLAGTYFAFGNTYATLLVIPLLFSLLAAWYLSAKVARNWLSGVLCVLVLIGSRAAIDYSTSGLENPLTHFLLALFFGSFFSADASTKSSPRHLLWLSFLTALGMTNRMDSFLLFCPALLLSTLEFFKSQKSWKSLLRVLSLGFAPFLAWELFSLIYYGSFVPNTALAKLNNGVASHELYAQGLVYLYTTLLQDPLTLLAVLVGLVLPYWTGERRQLYASLGILLYLLYILRIGGDFMMGRFLTAPLFVSLLILSQVKTWTKESAFITAATTLLISAVAPLTTLPVIQRELVAWKIPRSGVADERAYYFRYTGLAHISRAHGIPQHPWWRKGKNANAKKVHISGTVGMQGASAKPKTYIIDYHALTDPLLSRLPPQKKSTWRIGHFRRNIPAGYVETLKSGRDQFEDRQLAELYGHVKRVVSGPLWTRERWRSIWLLQTGRLKHLIDGERYEKIPEPPKASKTQAPPQVPEAPKTQDPPQTPGPSKVPELPLK